MELSDYMEEVEAKSVILGLLIGVFVASSFFTFMHESSGQLNVLSEDRVGQKTVNFVNSNILQKSPNNVTAELVEVKEPEVNLTNFYQVKMNVSNPSGSQITSVYARKDGSIVFLQLPRKMGSQFDPSKYG